VTIRGVLLDFSGTLFRLEVAAEALAEGLSAEHFALLRGMTVPTGQFVELPPDLSRDWDDRDLDPTLHRRANLAALRAAGVTDDQQAVALYELMLRADSWQPYPDTRAALELLRAKGIPTAVVSNIAWDIRPAFDRVGLADLVDAYVLSYVEGVAKPAPGLFKAAARRLGLDPTETLMIGDSEKADGGAAAVGATVAIVEPLPTDERPDALLRVLAEHGLSG
jgi:HAD superfamily hydrolase (TIGR01509 family)